MCIKAKTFDELTSRELYEILKARAEIFVVEQDCKYQDMDDIDFKSLHIFYQDGDTVTAYLRAYYKEDEPETVKIGRVLTLEHGKGLGKRLLKESIEIIRERMDTEEIYIEAQCHAIGFYEKEGFKVCSEEFLEVGIPHKQMRLKLRNKN